MICQFVFRFYFGLIVLKKCWKLWLVVVNMFLCLFYDVDGKIIFVVDVVLVIKMF